MSQENPYQPGGTVAGKSYIRRKADEDLKQAIATNNAFPYLLAARQSGKSSVLSHARSSLATSTLHLIIVDLSEFPPGALRDYDAFLLHFLHTIALELRVDKNWEARIRQAAALERPLLNTVRALLSFVSSRLIVCIDEIDVLLHTTFKDDLFGQIRGLFNRRADEASLRRIQFVLAGAAPIQALISDKHRSPFNVGEKIVLQDLDVQGVKQLLMLGWKSPCASLDHAARRLFSWTEGSVYLCQCILYRVFNNTRTLGKRTPLADAIDSASEELVHDASNIVHSANMARVLAEDRPVLHKWLAWQDGTPPADPVVDALRIVGISSRERPFKNQLYRIIFGRGGPLWPFPPEPLTFSFDVLLSCSPQDRVKVRELARRLKSDGLHVWFDEWEVKPEDTIGLKVEHGMEQSRTLVICLSANAMLSERARLERAATLFRLPLETGRRLVVVRLDNIKVPTVFGGAPCVDLQVNPQEGYFRLFDLVTPQPPATRRIWCRLRCGTAPSEILDLRPAAFVSRLCRSFPQTEFHILKDCAKQEGQMQRVNAKSPVELTRAEFHDGDGVTLEVGGLCKIMASEFFRVAWENLKGYSDDMAASKGRIAALIDDVFHRIEDPEIEAFPSITAVSSFAPEQVEREESRSVAIINDRLHNLSLPMVPLIAKYFGSWLQMAFEVPMHGVFVFTMGPENGYALPSRILELEVEVGTRVTLLTWGANRFKTNETVKAVLENLWQCDQWLRKTGKQLESRACIEELLEFAKQTGQTQSAEYGYVQNPFISNLLTKQHICINEEGREFTKRQVLRQLAGLHCRIHGLGLASVLARVEEAESRQSVIVREGFAVAHGTMDRTPRIAMSFGVYPRGVTWTDDGRRAELVCMVICAKDTYGTWRDYLRKMATVFRANPILQMHLVRSQSSGAFLEELRKAEVVLSR